MTEPRVDRQPGGPEGDNAPGALDPVAEAEAVRAALHEAAGRLARLLAALKQQRREARAVRAAVQSLKNLRLDP